MVYHQTRDMFVVRNAVLGDDPSFIEPAYRITSGYNGTLDKKNISQEVKDFYDMYYEKAKVTIVTRGDLGKTFLDQIEFILKRIDNKSIMKTHQTNSVLPKNWMKSSITKDYFILTNTSTDPLLSIRISCTAPRFARESVNYLSRVLTTILTQILVNDLELCSSVSVSGYVVMDSVDWEISLELTGKGRNSMSDIIFYTLEGIRKLPQYNNKDDYYLWSDAIKAENFFLVLGEYPAELTSSIASNYGQYGINHIFVGGRSLTEYNKMVIGELIEGLLKEPRVFLYHGSFAEDVDVNNDVLQFFKTDVTKSGSNSKATYSLDNIAEIENTSYTYFKLSKWATETIVDKLRKEKKSELVDIQPNKDIPSTHFLKMLSEYMPSKAFRNDTTPDLLNFSYIINEKYQVPSVNVYVNFNPNMEPTKETFIWMKYYTEILNRRAMDFGENLSAFRTKFQFFLNSFGITMQLNILSEKPVDILRHLLSHVFKKLILEEEHQYALAQLWELRIDDQRIFDKAGDVFSNTYFSFEAYPKDYEEFVLTIRNSEDRPQELPDLYIGWTHLEQTTKSSLTPKELNEELSLFNHGQVGFYFAPHIKLETNKILLKREINMDENSRDSKGYYACNYIGRSSPEVRAFSQIVEQTITNVAYEYLRTNRSIGYQARVVTQELKHDTMVCVVIQGDKSIEYIEKSVEEFYQVAEDFLKELGQEQFQATVDGLISKSISSFKGPEDEALFWYYYSMTGYGIDYHEKMREYLRGITKAVFLERYNDMFKMNPQRMIAELMDESLIDSPVITKSQLYSPYATIELI